MTGIIGGISRNKFVSLAVPVPPLAEQHRIAAKVDELMALCDILEQQQEDSIQAHETLVEVLLEALTSAADADAFQAAWQRISEHFDVLFTTERSVDKLKETVLQLAVMGKLVPQDPTDEPASDLLRVLQSNKQALIREKKAKDSGNTHPKAPTVPPFTIPHSWLWVRFRELIWCFRGHNPPKSEFLYQPKEGYVRFIQITDFKTNDSAVYVPISPKNKMVYRGEIIMAAYRHIGKLSRHMEGAFNVALCKILEYQPMNRDYIELLIGTDAVKGELLSASERGHIPSMHSDHLLSLLVPLPPKEEQQRIVAKVDELMALCDQLKESLQQVQQTQIHLTDTVVENAL
jgi:type I restriction enzyme S subunit